jgi:hypothetical protein
MKSRETLGRSHNFNTTDGDTGLTKSFSASTKLGNISMGI